MKMIFQEIFPPKKPVTNMSKMDTGPLIKFTVSEFNCYQFFSLLINFYYLT